MSEYRVDEAFAIVPMWLIESKISDRALRLYALLSGMRDYGTNMATVGRKLLASKIECSTDSLDRAKAELEEIGAITVERKRNGGEIERNIYTVHRAPVGSRTDAATAVAAPERLGGTAAARSPLKDESSSSSSKARRVGRAPTQIGGAKVTGDEEQFALAVLGVFNEVSGRKFGSKEALGKIVLRHREHPDLVVEDHRRVIEQQFEKPWWKGDPSPSVVYGNGEVFDRALNGVRGVGNNGSDDEQADDPYARGAIRADADSGSA